MSALSPYRYRLLLYLCLGGEVFFRRGCYWMVTDGVSPRNRTIRDASMRLLKKAGLIGVKRPHGVGRYYTTYVASKSGRKYVGIENKGG